MNEVCLALQNEFLYEVSFRAVSQHEPQGESP